MNQQNAVSVQKSGYNYQVIFRRAGEDFYSVLAEVKDSGLCPEHGFSAERVALDLAAGYRVFNNHGDSLEEIPDRKTVYEFQVKGPKEKFSFVRWCGTLEQFKKDCHDYCSSSIGSWEKVSNKHYKFHECSGDTWEFRAVGNTLV